MLRRTGRTRPAKYSNSDEITAGKTTLRSKSRARNARPSCLCALASLSLLMLTLWRRVEISPRFAVPPQRNLQISWTESECRSYGCPVYPPEKMHTHTKSDPDARVEQRAASSSRPFASETMATLTQKGNRDNPPLNQDAAVIISPFRTLQTMNESDFFLGIFDGHGDEGHIVARYAAKDVPDLLAQKLDSLGPLPVADDVIVQLLNETFIQVDRLAPPNAMRGGCTGSVTLRRGSKLFVANAGDSRTIVVTVNDDQEDTVYMSRKDKPHLPDELIRIEALGGNVHIPPKNPALSRVVVYSTVAREMIGLAMSRSIGDWEWKAVGVTAEPLVDVLDLENMKKAFIVAASDGVWDMRRPLFFAKRFADSFFRSNLSPFNTAIDLIERITPKNTSFYRDDITLIAKKLEL